MANSDIPPSLMVLFYHFIKGEIGPIFSHLLTVRAEVADPPSPPLTVSLTVKRPLFFLTTSPRMFEEASKVIVRNILNNLLIFHSLLKIIEDFSAATSVHLFTG